MDRAYAVIALAEQTVRFAQHIGSQVGDRKPSLKWANVAYERLYAVAHYAYDIDLIDADTCEAIAFGAARSIKYLKEARKTTDCSGADALNAAQRRAADIWAARLRKIAEDLRESANSVTLTTTTA